MTEVILAANQYGKAENRVVRVIRDTARHEVVDLNVTSQLRGDFEAAHTQGDNSHVVATDTQKNTIFAFAKDGVPSPEEFLLRLADHFTGDFDWVTGGRWAADLFGWTRIDDHDHAFYRGSPEVRTAVLVRDGDTNTMLSGFYGLTVMKTTESGFVGYPKDKYTTLKETTDRILATDISTKWRYNTTDPADRLQRAVRQRQADHHVRVLAGLLERVAAGPLRHGRGGDREAPADRRDQVLLSEQAPLPLGPVRSAAWRTPARSSTPPTVRTG